VVRGLLNHEREGRIEENAKVLLLHLGGSTAIHAYADRFRPIELCPFEPPA